MDSTTLRVTAIAAGFGLVLSLLTGLVSGNPFVAAFGRGIVSAVLFGGLIFGALYLVRTYLPELLALGRTAEQRVDITLPEENPHRTNDGIGADDETVVDVDALEEIEVAAGEASLDEEPADLAAAESDEDSRFGEDPTGEPGSEPESLPAGPVSAGNGNDEIAELDVDDADGEGDVDDMSGADDSMADIGADEPATDFDDSPDGSAAPATIEELGADEEEDVESLSPGGAEGGGDFDSLSDIESSGGGATDNPLGVDPKEIAQALRTVLKKDEG